MSGQIIDVIWLQLGNQVDYIRSGYVIPSSVAPDKYASTPVDSRLRLQLLRYGLIGEGRRNLLGGSGDSLRLSVCLNGVVIYNPGLFLHR